MPVTSTSSPRDSHTMSPKAKRASIIARGDDATLQTFSDDPLSPVADQDLSETDMRRISSSDTTSTIRNIQPSISTSSSSAPLFEHDRAGSDDIAAVSTSTNGTTERLGRSSLYDRQASADDGYKSQWAVNASTDHLNPSIPSNESDEYGKPNFRGRMNGTYNGGMYADYSEGSLDGRADATEDGGDEARQVQQNLERWAAAEKRRRKAARTSRSSFLGPPEGGSLARRLTFGRRASGTPFVTDGPTSPNDRNPSLLHNTTSTTASVSSNDSIRTDSRRGSSESSQRNGSVNRESPTRAGADGNKTLEDVPEDDDRTLSPSPGNGSSRSSKGKGRALDEGNGTWEARTPNGQGLEQSPFADPSDVSQKRRSLKPTATRPIVTPGRAPSIRRTPANTPQIIATDVDAQNQDRKQQHRLSSRGGAASAAENPFLSASEAVQAAENGGHYRPRTHEVIEEDERDIGMPSMTRATTSDSLSSTTSTITNRQPSARYSMSKFREVGLDGDEGEEDENVPASELERRRQLKRVMTGDDDASVRGYPRGARYDRRDREAEEDRRRVREGKGRQPWWTEWLCGCGRVVDDDNEQTGKTGPE